MVRCENVAKMALGNDDDVIKTFPSDRADQPLRISVLPRRPRRDRSVANAHGPDAPDEVSAIRAVTVADQVAWRLVPAASFGQLTSKPFHIGIGCHTALGAGERHPQGYSSAPLLSKHLRAPHRSSYPGGIDRLGGRAILINHLCRFAVAGKSETHHKLTYVLKQRIDQGQCQRQAERHRLVFKGVDQAAFGASLGLLAG